MSSTYRSSSRTALNVVSTSRSRSLVPALRNHPLATRRHTSTVAEAAAATATTRQASHPPPSAHNEPAQEPWKGKGATGLQDTLSHAYGRELGRLQFLTFIYDAVQGGLQWGAIRYLLVPMDEHGS